MSEQNKERPPGQERMESNGPLLMPQQVPPFHRDVSPVFGQGKRRLYLHRSEKRRRIAIRVLVGLILVALALVAYAILGPMVF